MELDRLSAEMLPALETALQTIVTRAGGTSAGGLREMLSYHMGWEGEGAGPEARGKRLRPLFLLLTTAAAGGRWDQALPAAAAVELLHNFSLIHDDIEDDSPLRHGRRTVWTLWGIPQALNAGDAMFALAQGAMLDLERTSTPTVTLEAARVLQETSLLLTQGQYLDLSYEGRSDLGDADYWPMIGGKTAALISACTRLGALIAGAALPICQAYSDFGRYLGLAFQVQDDLLGIWGDIQATGKSADSDLVSGKKSLPVLYALNRNGRFAERWLKGSIQMDEVPALAAQLKAEGAYDYAKDKADELTRQALSALDTAQPRDDAGQTLYLLTRKLLHRRS